MVLQYHPPITSIDDFIVYARLPENANRTLEFLNGVISEKMPGSTENSTLAFYLGFIVQSHCETASIPCYITGEAGAYCIGQNILVPDFAYKPTPPTVEYQDPIPPLWVMEVISPHDKPGDIRQKRQRYLEAGILLWELYPDEQVIDVYAPAQPLIAYSLGAVIPVPVIAGLTVELARLFR